MKIPMANKKRSFGVEDLKTESKPKGKSMKGSAAFDKYAAEADAMSKEDLATDMIADAAMMSKKTGSPVMLGLPKEAKPLGNIAEAGMRGKDIPKGGRRGGKY